ncbi:CBS domain-containing protein [archaeon]|nr:CBS domain-containing protein [archaeon]
MILEEVMTKNPITVEADDHILDAVKVLRENKINGVPVMKDGKFVGLLTNEELLDFMEVHEFGRQLLLPAPLDVMEAVINYQAELTEVEKEFERMKNSKVKDVMEQNPITAEGDMHVSEAADVMTENHITHLPVIKNDKLVGLVTRSDLLKSLI